MSYELILLEAFGRYVARKGNVSEGEITAATLGGALVVAGHLGVPIIIHSDAEGSIVKDVVGKVVARLVVSGRSVRIEAVGRQVAPFDVEPVVVADRLRRVYDGISEVIPLVASVQAVQSDMWFGDNSVIVHADVRHSGPAPPFATMAALLPLYSSVMLNEPDVLVGRVERVLRAIAEGRWNEVLSSTELIQFLEKAGTVDAGVD